MPVDFAKKMSDAARATEKKIVTFQFQTRACVRFGSVSFGSVRLTEPCHQVRIRFGSVEKFQIWSVPISRYHCIMAMVKKSVSFSECLCPRMKIIG